MINEIHFKLRNPQTKTLIPLGNSKIFITEQLAIWKFNQPD